MTITLRRIAGVVVVLFDKEVNVEVSIVGAAIIEVDVTPNLNAQADALYVVELSVDGVAQGNRGLSWSAAEITSSLEQTVIFTGVDLNAIDRILVEVAVNDGLPELAIFDGATTVGVSGLLEVRMNLAATGVAGYIAKATIRDATIARFVDVVFPGDFPLASHVPDPVSGPFVEFRGVDLGALIQSGAAAILLASLSVEGLAVGSTVVDLNVTTLDDDGGFDVERVELAGVLTVT